MTSQQTHGWSVGGPEFMMLIEDDPSAADVVDSFFDEDEDEEKPLHLDFAKAIAEALASRDLCPMDWLERVVTTSVATHYYLTTNTPCPFEDVNVERSISSHAAHYVARNPAATVTAERLLMDALYANGFAYAGIRSWEELMISDNWVRKNTRTYPGDGKVCQMGPSKFVGQRWVDERVKRSKVYPIVSKCSFTGYPIELSLADMAIEGPPWVREISRMGFCIWEWFPEGDTKSWALIARSAYEERIPWPTVDDRY